MTRFGKLALGALLMAGTAMGSTVALTTPASAGVVVGVGVPGYYPYYPYYGYYGYPGYYGYGGPYVGVGWGWHGGCCWGGWRGAWGGWHGGYGGWHGGWGGWHGAGFHGPSAAHFGGGHGR